MNTFLEGLSIPGQQLRKARDIIGTPMSLLIRDFTQSHNITRGICSLYGMEDLAVEVDQNTPSIIIRFCKNDQGDFTMQGIEWLKFKSIELSVEIPDQEEKQVKGKLSAITLFPEVTFEGTLVEEERWSIGGISKQYYWKMVSQEVKELSFDKLFPADLPVANFIKEVKDLVSSIISKIELKLGSHEHTLTVFTPLSWSITNNLIVDSLKAHLTWKHSSLLHETKAFAISGSLHTTESTGFEVFAGFLDRDSLTRYVLDIHSIKGKTISIADIIGETSNDWLPKGWAGKLSKTGLSYLHVEYTPAIGAFNVASRGIFQEIESQMEFSLKPFLGNRYFSFSVTLFNEPKSIREILHDDLGIEVVAEIPSIKIALQQLSFDQLARSFHLSGAMEFGDTNAIKLQGSLDLQWANGLDFSFKVFSYGASLSLEKIAAAISPSLLEGPSFFSKELSDKIKATSFNALQIGVNTSTQNFRFSGEARIFNDWTVTIDFNYTKQENKRFVFFQATVRDLKIEFRDIVKQIGLAQLNESLIEFIPEITVFPKYFCADQKNNFFSIASDFAFSGVPVSSSMSIGKKDNRQNIILSVETGEEQGLKLTVFLHALFPKLGIDSGNPAPFDIALQSLNLNLEKESGRTKTKGHIKGYMSLLNSRIELSAESTDEDGKEWEFKATLDTSKDVISIGELADELVAKLNLPKESVPAFLHQIELHQLEIIFHKTDDKWNFKFLCDAMISFDKEKSLKAHINIDVKDKKTTFDGLIVFHNGANDLHFDIHFGKEKDTSLLLASYSHTGDQKIKLGGLVHLVSTDEDLIALANNVEIDLKDVVFLYEKKGNNNTEKRTENQKGENKQDPTSTFLFAFDIGTQVNLSNLPLVGKELPPDQSLQADIQVTIASRDLSKKELTSFNSQFPSGVKPIIIDQEKAGTEDKTVLQNGLTLGAELKWGETTKIVSFPIKGKGKQQPPPKKTIQLASADSPSTDTPSSGKDEDDRKGVWLSIQKNIGPVHIEKIGVNYTDNKIWFMLDAALSAAGLTIALQGLSIGSPLNGFKPQFDLLGLGIDYKGGETFEIGGAFLRKEVKEDDQIFYEYNGGALIKTKALTLSAIGSYTERGGHPSLFLYALLNYPLGGPAFFFVTGLAAAFGYNRSLVVPAIEKIPEFPLVKLAMNSQSDEAQGADKLVKVLDSIRQYIPPSTGEIFLAAGIKFTSFKIVDSFALLTLAFGKRFELNLLGLSNLVAPPPEVGKSVTPLAEVQLALKATFIPEEGFLGVMAQLTQSSYLLSKNCHLTGGFAFYTWFSGKYAGDFVITLGGYHPHFRVPDHYPKVPRIGFNWQVDKHITLKGDVYAALTSFALMAGGHLEATYDDGALKAWFYAGADFLISWKPYHYEAHVYVDIGASYTFDLFGTHTISVEVGADVELWGPDFGGKATLHLYIFTIDVSFGDQQDQVPQPVDWTTFKQSFLPDDQSILTVAIQQGLVKKSVANENNLGFVDPKHLSIVTNTVIPFSMANGVANGVSFGVAPMDIRFGKVHSDYSVAIKKDGQEVESGTFDFLPVYKKLPAGLWGNELKPKVNSSELINVRSGFEITPRRPDDTDLISVNKKELCFDNTSIHAAFRWQEDKMDTGRCMNEAIRKEMEATLFKNVNRDQLLSALGFESSVIDISETWVNSLFETI